MGVLSGMDSFSMLFRSTLGVSDLCLQLARSGFVAKRVSTDDIVVASGDARVWIEVSSPEDLEPCDCEDEADWPIPRDQAGNFLSLSVRRNPESDALAIRIAHRHVTSMHGAILWDGMDYWERLCKAYVEGKGVGGRNG